MFWLAYCLSVLPWRNTKAVCLQLKSQLSLLSCDNHRLQKWSWHFLFCNKINAILGRRPCWPFERNTNVNSWEHFWILFLVLMWSLWMWFIMIRWQIIMHALFVYFFFVCEVKFWNGISSCNKFPIYTV